MMSSVPRWPTKKFYLACRKHQADRFTTAVDAPRTEGEESKLATGKHSFSIPSDMMMPDNSRWQLRRKIHTKTTSGLRQQIDHGGETTPGYTFLFGRMSDRDTEHHRRDQHERQEPGKIGHKDGLCCFSLRSYPLPYLVVNPTFAKQRR